MRVLLRITLLMVSLAVARDAIAQEPAGSKLSPDENNCAACHGERDLWEATLCGCSYLQKLWPRTFIGSRESTATIVTAVTPVASMS